MPKRSIIHAKCIGIPVNIECANCTKATSINESTVASARLVSPRAAET